MTADMGFAGGTRAAKLTDKFVVPPFSVLDTRQGYWQERRRAWLALGIQSELGRGNLTVGDSGPIDRSSPGGSLLPSASYSRDHARGDSRGRAYSQAADPKWRGANNVSAAATTTLSGGWGNHASQGPARTSAQDLMRGEHVVGDRLRREVDATSNVTGAPPLPDWADNGTANMAPGTSLFDPVLCELIYRWFAPEGGTVLDPFAGGSVRGLVAAYLGHPYIGIDLSRQQVEANRAQSHLLSSDRPVPEWIVGDSGEALGKCPQDVDLVFSCPPYFDLEVYSDDPADLSSMTWGGFLDAYQRIIDRAIDKLETGRFAVFVVSEVRGASGAYRGLVPATIAAFERAGAHFYNEIILINSIGSLPIRITRQFEAGRKVGRTHQNVLVFLKGDQPRGWSYDREAPADPQLALFAEGVA